VSQGRKKEFEGFGWSPESLPDPEKKETYDRSKLNWAELAKGEHAEMLSWYRDLIRLRKSTPALNNGEPGNTQVTVSSEENWLRIKRGNVTLHCNLGDKVHTIALPENATIALSSFGTAKVKAGAVSLPPNTVSVVLTIKTCRT